MNLEEMRELRLNQVWIDRSYQAVVKQIQNKQADAPEEKMMEGFDSTATDYTDDFGNTQPFRYLRGTIGSESQKDKVAIDAYNADVAIYNSQVSKMREFAEPTNNQTLTAAKNKAGSNMATWLDAFIANDPSGFNYTYPSNPTTEDVNTFANSITEADMLTLANKFIEKSILNPSTYDLADFQ